MRSLKTVVLLACAALVVGVVAASAMGPATLKVEKTKLGKVVANSKGLTLYMFRKDGKTSACYGACVATWPPLVTSGKPTAGPGITGSLIGTTKRKDGKLQVTYKGHPLYTYVTDKKPGQTTGEGSKLFGAGWYALTPTGIVIDRG
jgi:predicted lipoprotein with Yx(FWY)xxD motif